MRRLLLFAFLSSTITCFAQVQTTVLQLTDANVRINTNGVLFHNLETSQGSYEAPADSGNNAIFDATLWISGLDSSDNLHTAAITYCQQNTGGFCEYYPGPLKTDGSASNNPEVFNSYNRFWFISRDEVEEHEAYFNCLNDPDCDTETEFPSGYTIPQEILDWPAHGNTNEGFPYYLAPFVDVDGDGSYHPENGDYPTFTGDKAVYMISNDNGTPHMNSQGQPLGVEIHTMIYYYLDTNPALSRTTFIHQDIINRTQTDYHDVYMGVWNDFDLGNANDDFIATDVENAYVYCYNGDATDESSAVGPGYGTDLPMIACKILAGPYLDPNGVDDLGLFDGTNNLEYGDYSKGWNDGIIDNERMGLSSSIYSVPGNSATGDPNISSDFYTYLRGIWLNGVPMTFGGNGYNPANQSAATAKYVFPGESDPLFFGTNGIDPGYMTAGGWSELNESNPPGDRRIQANCGPFSLNAGQTQSLDYVYVFARQSDNPGEDLHDILNDHIQTAAATPDSLPVSVVSSVRQIHPEQIGFVLYPNPAGDKVTVTLSGNVQGKYRMYNVLGAQVGSGVLKSGETIIDLSDLEHGLYLVNITVGDRSATRKLLVE